MSILARITDQESEERRAQLRTQMALTAAELGRHREAIAYWWQALSEGYQPEAALIAIEKLAAAHGYWDSVLQVCDRRLDEALGERRSLLARKAGVLKAQLGRE